MSQMRRRNILVYKTELRHSSSRPGGTDLVCGYGSNEQEVTSPRSQYVWRQLPCGRSAVVEMASPSKRSQFWGTPIPMWVSQDGWEVVCFGSIKELEERTGQKITDLSPNNIDRLEIPSMYPFRPPIASHSGSL